MAFDEYRPVALWCDADETCYFLDHTGLAFAKAPVLTGSAFVRFREPRKAFSPKSVMVDRTFLQETMDFSERLQSVLNLYVTEVYVADELDVSYFVSGGGEIKASRDMEVDITFANLQSILTSQEFVHLNGGAFAYIDLRFGDKVFVNEEGEVASQEKTASSSEEAVP